VRTDPSKDEDFQEELSWGNFSIELFSQVAQNGNGDKKEVIKSTPFSGNERNRLFMQTDGHYEDMTLVSGGDFSEDGRGFVLFDYDNDGWIDMGIVSPNYPRFRILRNCLGDSPSKQNSFVELELVGGQTTTQPTTKLSPREPLGAKVMVTSGGKTRAFQLNGTAGLSSQNSRRLHIGMGTVEKIDTLEILWPSGKTTTKSDVKAGQRLKITEVE
jgi:hypothetical protein